MAHTDGPAYWPRTATLSLSSAAIMVLLAPRGEDGGATPLCEVILPARSLVVFDGAAYEALHAIPPRAHDVVGAEAPCLNAEDAPAGAAGWPRAARMSVTLRHVPPAPQRAPPDG